MFGMVKHAKSQSLPGMVQALNTSRALPVSSAGSLVANTRELMNYKLTGNYEDLEKIGAILQ